MIIEDKFKVKNIFDIQMIPHTFIVNMNQYVSVFVKC